MNAAHAWSSLGRDALQIRARPLLGTIVEIAADCPDPDRTRSAIEEAFRVVEEIHRLMSYHDASSDVSRINQHAAVRDVEVSAHTWRVLEAARAFAEASDGLFDITVAPTLTALGFLPRHPGAPRISGQGDWRHVELLPGGVVRLARRLRIDLGGIAKGYAVDCAIRVLEARGMTSGRVNAGGDLRVFGAHAQIIHVRHPRVPTTLLPLAASRAIAAATSGDYFSARWVGGRRVTPLIHPRTRASCGQGRSVTVLAGDCMTADALTKVVQADPGLALTVLPQFAARAIMLQERDGICETHASDGMRGDQWRVHWLPSEPQYA